MRDAEHATPRTPLAPGRATLCFDFNFEPHSPEGPEHVKKGIHCLKTADLGWLSLNERY